MGPSRLGFDLPALVVGPFFAQNGLTPTARESQYGVHHVASNIDLIYG